MRKMSAWQVLRFAWWREVSPERFVIQTPFFCIEIADWARDYMHPYPLCDFRWKGYQVGWWPRWWHGINEGEMLYAYEHARIIGSQSRIDYIRTGKRPA